VKIAQLRCPIVLVHGLFGFDQFRVGPWLRLEYFHGIPDALRQAGNRVFSARLSPTGGIACRAEQLRDFLLQHSPGEPVHLFAHSMGGLDSRYLISRLNMAGHVLSLTTLGTPHRGSPFADWAMGRLVRLVGPVFDTFALPRQAFADLTVASCREFNEQTPDAPGVRYFSVAGRFRPCWYNPSWHLSAPIVEKQEGPSDGIVSVASATWGESCEQWEGDHMSLINWTQPGTPAGCGDRLPHYAALVGRLRDEGF
jgi:triacylglycerol lipase